jgi:hypothetical protein
VITGPAHRPRRQRIGEALLSLRTAGFLAKRLWRPALIAAAARIAHHR